MSVRLPPGTAAARVALALALALAALASPRATPANGRFPQALQLVIAPGAGDTLVLRTTFGLLVSRDAGGTWRWVCEAALSHESLGEFPVAVGVDGTVVVGVNEGLATSRALCTWDHPAGDPGVVIADLTADGSGQRLLAAAQPQGAANSVAVSDDGGHTWRGAMRFPPDLLIATLDVAPGMPARVYVSGRIGGVAVLYRSDDGGTAFREVSRGFDGAGDVYIAAVDPARPDVVYLRATHGRATALLRSEDGGAHATTLTRTSSPMLGFALSDDGSTVWFSGSDPGDGVERSVGGGPFARVSAMTADCLRYRAGVLYACTTEALQGYSLARSTDGGAHFTPLLALRDVAGPVQCAAGTTGHDRCEPMWPAQSAAFPRPGPGLDAGAAPDATPRPPPLPETHGGCGCRVSRVSAGDVGAALVLAALTALGRRRTGPCARNARNARGRPG